MEGRISIRQELILDIGVESQTDNLFVCRYPDGVELVVLLGQVRVKDGLGAQRLFQPPEEVRDCMHHKTLLDKTGVPHVSIIGEEG